MKPTSKPVKKNKTLGGKKLEKTQSLKNTKLGPIAPLTRVIS